MKSPESFKQIPLQQMVKEFLDRKLPINKPIINTCGDVITPSETYREFMKKHMRAMETYIATQAAFFMHRSNLLAWW